MTDPAIVRQQIENLRLQFPELEEDEADWLLSLESETDINELLSKIVDRLDEVSVLRGGLAGKIAQLEVRDGRFKDQELKLRACALALMQIANLQKKVLPSATLSVRAGRSQVVILDEAMVPDIMCKITRAPDKTIIRKTIEQGGPLNWARLEDGKPSLAILTK
jgi:hypothetical protein